MKMFRDLVEVLTPGSCGVGVITLTDVKDAAAIAVAVVSIVCTILITAHKLRKE